MCFHDLHLGDLPWCNISKSWSALGRNSCSLPFQMTSCEVSIIHIIIWRLPFESSSRQKKSKETDPKKMTYPMCFLCSSVTFCWFHPPPNRSRHCDAQTFTSTFDPQKTRLSRGELHHPFCHDVIALRNRGGGSGHSPIFVSWDFYGKFWKKKKGISSLTSFSEHCWLFGGAREISKDAHVPTV